MDLPTIHLLVGWVASAYSRQYSGNTQSGADGTNIGGGSNGGGFRVMLIKEEVPDSTAPTVTITSPADETYTNQSSITVYATASDETGGSGIDYVDIIGAYGSSITGRSKRVTATYNNGKYEAKFNFSDLPDTSSGATKNGDGWYSFKAFAYDKAGNEGVSGNNSSIQVNLDTVVPVWDKNISNGTYSSSAKTYTFNLVGSDETSLNSSSSTLNTSKVAVYINGTKQSTSNYTVGTGTLSGNTKTFPVTIKNFTGGTVKVEISAGALVDEAGNTSVKTTTNEVTIDVTSPTVTITSSPTSPTKESTITYTFTFSEVVTGFAKEDITITGVTPSSSTFSGSGTTYTLKVTNPTSASGTQYVSVAKDKCTDDAGNGNEASATYEMVIDKTGPTVNITSSPSGTTNSTSITYTITFSEAVTGLDKSEITISGLQPSSSTLTGSGTTYTLKVTNSGSGTQKVSVGAGKCTDSAGNSNQASNTCEVVVDLTKPTVNITSNPSGTTNSTSITYTITFSEAVTGFAKSDITISGVTPTSSTLSGSGTTYTLQVTNPSSTSGTQKVSVGAGKCTDSAGNSNTASNTCAVPYDPIKPTVTITADKTSPTNASSITFTYKFSEPVTPVSNTNKYTYSSEGITMTRDFTGSGDTYTLVISEISGNGHIQPSLFEGMWVDEAGNTNTGICWGPTIVIDQNAPTWDANISGGQLTGTTFQLNLTGSDETSLKDASSKLSSSNVTVTLNGSTVSPTNLSFGTTSINGNSKTFPLTIKNLPTNADTISVKITINAGGLVDTAGNSSAKKEYTFGIDFTPPKVTITADKTSPTNASSITYTFTFDENVQNFTKEDITITSNGITSTKGDFNGSGNIYTLVVNNSGNSGTQTVSVAEGVCTDMTGNNNEASEEPRTIEIDRIAPTVTITADKTSPTNASSITYTFTFSESVTGFASSDITVTDSGITSTKGEFKGSGKTYTLVVNNSGNNGTQTVSVAAGVCTDSAGNGNTSKSFSIPIDRTAPVWAADVSNKSYNPTNKSVSLNLVGSDETSLNTSSATLISSGTEKNITVTLNGSTTTNISLGTATVNGNTKTFPLTINNLPAGSDKITVKITISAGALVDTATNTSASKEYTFDVDTKSPTVEITANPSQNPTNASSITYTFTFSENVTGFASNDISVNNGNKGTFGGSGKTYTLVVTNSGNCTQTVSVADGVCTDTSGNTNEGDSISIVIDRTVPKWENNISNGTYTKSAKTYTLNLIGYDESALNDAESKIEDKLTITVDGVNATYTLGQATLNDARKTFPLIITNFTGGNVSITIDSGALVDTAGNTSATKTYSFFIDGTSPEWADEVSNKVYNSSLKQYSLNLVGSDEVALKDAESVLTGKIAVTVDGSNASYDLGTPTLSADGKTKTFPLTITNFTGGTIKIVISAEALVDTSNNKSEVKEYEFDADVIAPVWGVATGTYNPDDQSYTITVSGSDETKINNTLSDLNTSNITLTVGGTSVTPTITTESTTSKVENYKITWQNHNGGEISLTIDPEALVDDTSNKSAEKTYTFDPVDVTKPTWADTVSGGSYDWDTGEYTLSFIGSDNEGLNDVASVLSSSNVTVTLNGSTVSSSDLVFGTPSLSADGKTKTFPLTIKNFTGGQVVIGISSGALVDTTGNKSNAKSPDYSFYIDVTRPVWNETISGGLYDPDTQNYTFNIIGTDETGLNSSSTLDSYISMTIGGSSATNFSLGTVVTSADGKTKTFPVTITNYTGGEIGITISAGALKDTSDNTSLPKEFTKFTPDITAPVWTYQNVLYDPDNRTYSVDLVGTDETQLDTTLSTLVASGTGKNVTVKCGETTVTPTITKISTTSTQVIYKLTINNYPGGIVNINIDKGALIDVSSNKSQATEIELAEKDIQKPTWTTQNQQYSVADAIYTFELVVVDNEELDSSVTLSTSGDSKNITVLCGNTEVTPIITRTIELNRIVYTVTINNYPSGKVYVLLSEGAAKDATGNKSDAVNFELPAEDIAKPEWQEEITVNYNYATEELVIGLVGKDETSLNDSKSVLELLNNVYVNVNGTTLGGDRVTITNGTISSDLMTKNYTITINNYEGGNVEISLDAGALEDLSGKISAIKTFTIDDVIRPIWSMIGDGEYNKSDGSYTIIIKGTDDTSLATALLTKENSDLTINSTEVENYEITDVTPANETNNSRTYSVKILNFTGGTISFSIDSEALIDNVGNKSIAATFTLTPDIVAPTWIAQNAGYTYEVANEVTVELVGTDDVQLLENYLELGVLTVTDGGNTVSSENLSLSLPTSIEDGKNGVKYVLTISGYSGGTINITIPAGTLEDPSGNVNETTNLTIDALPPINDTTPPVVTVVSSQVDKAAESIIIVFDVTDDWFDFDETVTPDEFNVKKTTSGYWGGMGGTTTDITSSVSIQVIGETRIENGKRFTIEVANLGITSSSSGTIWGGGTPTITVKLNANAIQDLSDNGNAETQLYSGQPDFALSSTDAPFLKTDVEVDEENKQVTILITGNTKNSWWNVFLNGTNNWNYSAEDFEADILDIKIDGESVKNLDNPEVTVTKVESSTSSSGFGFMWWWTGSWYNSTTLKFAVTLSDFEESTWQTGKSFTEWSGNIELLLGDDISSAVTISESALLDHNTEGRMFADFINPQIIVDETNISSDMDTVTFTLLATDKYYTPDQSIDPNKVNLLIDGVTATKLSHGTTLSFATPTVLEFTRNGATEQYGIRQDITIKGLATHLGKGLKLRLGEGTIIDLSGNPNIQKDISIFNTLMAVPTETAATSGFLGNTSIQRQNIESVEFLNNTLSAPPTGTWDVSAAQDGTIIAWATGSGPYQVYIASDGPIYANKDSSYLFSYIGYSSSCTDTTVIKGLDKLNTVFANNMTRMFQYCGHKKMTSLTLGEKFDTSNVTDMTGMFQYCGYTAMTTLNLGPNFDTSNVTNMSFMFNYCGYTAMTGLIIGQNFDTSSVTNMSNMFNRCGYTSLQSLDLGDKFYTKNVTDMTNMFSSCGETAMTTLDLGPAFTKIADTNSNFATNLGKSGAITIYTGEAIYSTPNVFKLSTVTGAGTIIYTRGTLNPIYKPQWSKMTTTLSTDYKTLTIKLQGTVNATDYGNAIKTVTNKLSNGIVQANSSTPINLKIDGDVANNITKEISMVYTGPSEMVTAQIVLSNFEEAVIQSGKAYKEWAGNVALQLATGTLVDSYGNRNLLEIEIKEETETDKNENGKMFADFIKPTVKYEHTDTIIDQTSKTATIVFCVLDKYYESSNLSIDNTEIQMDGVDLRLTPVEIGWAEEQITEYGKIVGCKYTITLTELQQDIIANGKSYLDFSGVVSIIVPPEVTDKSGNINNATTITVGIDEPENPDHDNHTSGTVIDFVDPIWSNVENGITLDFENSTAIVKVKATDKYFAPEKCVLTSDDIKLYLDGVEITTGITKQIISTAPLKEIRAVNGVQTEVQYGSEYTIKITGITLNSDQAKIIIPAGTIEDQHGNTSDENTIILYNRLRSAEIEMESTSPFLGNQEIQRQDIQNVTFVSGITGSTDADTIQVWDVSAAGDGSIIAWTKQEQAPYTIYIGSEGAILANRNSSYLFAHIGYGAKSSVTQTITNLELLETSSVTNMQGMFWFCGYRAMTSLDLGDNFDTSNVTNMKEMFTGCGYKAMTSLDLGDNFDTTNVLDMSWMFANCGYTKMIELNLGTSFITNNVTDMSYMFMDCGYMSMTTLTLGNSFNTTSVQTMNSMFRNCGHEKMTALNLGTTFITNNVTNMSSMFEEVGYKSLTSLNLGSYFNTSKVTDMSRMFYGTGATSMVSLTLGDDFDTTIVTNMNSMFMNCGQSSMTSLNLGGKFYTTNVTDMTNMFNACGQSNMTSLDLGPAFTKIAATNTGFATDCGKMGNIVVYVGEAIYSNINAFRLNTDSTTEISFTRGTINPKYRPEWEKISTTYDATAKTLTITIEGLVNSANYANYIQTVTNTFVAGTTTLVDVRIDGDARANDDVTKTASLVDGEPNKCVITLSNFDIGESIEEGMPFDEWSGNVALQIARGTLVDAYGNKNLVIEGEYVEDTEKTNANTNGKQFADFVKPEIRYEYSETQINYNTKTVTVYFSITDKYFKGLKTDTVANVEAMANLITVEVDEDDEVNSVITKTVTEVQDVDYVINSMNTVVGKQYKIVIQGLDRGDGLTYSGPMSLTFPENLAEDYSGNMSNGKTITIGIDDPENPDHDHDSEVIVDVVEPIWKIENATPTTADLIATDKYLSEYPTAAELKELIQIKVGDTVKTEGITITGPTDVTNGKKYSLTIPNYESEGLTEEYEDFMEQRELYEDSEGAEGRLYREQFAGEIVAIIPEGTIKDSSGNTNKVTEFFMGTTNDTLRPETILVSSTPSSADKTETIIFDITDKNYKTSTIDADDIYVFVDKVETTAVSKQITNVETLTATVEGAPRTIGKRYTLVISDFEAAGLENGYDYKGLSGTVSIEIAEGVATDQADNINTGRKSDGTNTSEGQPMVGDFVDFIKPILVYRSSQTIKNADEVQIVFDVTDKYFSSSTLTLADLTIMIQDGTDDSNYIDLKEITGISVEFGETDKYEDGPLNKTISGVVQTGLTNQIIGKTYTITIKDIEQAEIANGRNYLDYSGNVTIALTNGKISDTSNNTNNNCSLTMGIEEPEGTGSKDALDIVRPIWALLSQDVDLDKQESTIKIRATDKYFFNSTLTNNSIELWIDGAKVETNGTTGRNITIISTTPIYETWIINGVSSQVQIGVEYEIKATGFDIDKQQAKIKIPQETITDQSGNSSAEMEFILYSCLMPATQETSPGGATTAFLNNPYEIQRQNIESITFVSGLGTADKTKWWDVSAVQDGSIMAWYKDSDGNGAYEVYIGSDGGIFANPDSSYLFSEIGSANVCEAEDVIIGLSLLNTKRVTNMEEMFYNCGSHAMTGLDLGNNFDTSNVTNMAGMFSGCGQNAMTELNLGSKFDTSNVTDMSNMFNGCGQNAMTTFKVAEKTNVVDFIITTQEDKEVDMSGMFQNFGQKLESLTLGENFDTSKVTNMSNMFNGTGKTSMKTLTLGNKFDTSKVTNMSGMFQDFATSSTEMTTLDLGDKFYTTQVTNMTNMFNGCGTAGITTLDLGPAFASISTINSGFVTNCGKSGEAVILAGQSIYSDMKTLKLSNSNATEIGYTNGTINPIYKPEWEKLTAEVATQTDPDTNEERQVIEIIAQGTVDSDIYAATVSGNLNSADLITVYVNGNAVTSLTKEVSTQLVVENEETGETEVQYTITITGFEEAVRQSGKNFKEWSGNISLQFAKGTLVDEYGHQNLNEIDIDTAGTMQKIELKDETESTANESGKMFIDVIKPEFTYAYTVNDINTENNTLTVVFDITDRYFNSTTIQSHANDITVTMLDDEDAPVNAQVTKTITKKTSATEIVNGNIKYDTTGNIYWNNIKVGERYELVITNFEKDENDGFDYSGPMSITFPSEIATDNSNNKNNAKTITIGINEPEGTGDPELVDLVDPIWEKGDVTVGTDSVTVKLRAKDKYFSTENTTIDEDDIIVKINGTASSIIEKDITSTTPTNIYDPEDATKVIGKEYTLVLSNLVPADGGYDTFIPSNLAQLDSETQDTYQYKFASENGGEISIEIEDGTAKDTSGNESQTTFLDVTTVDLVKPEVFVVRKTPSPEYGMETIIFNVTDKNYDSSKVITTEELTLWIDDVQIDSLIESAALSSVEIKTIIDDEEKIVGHQYTLIVPNIVENTKQDGKQYLEWSGTLRIEIDEDASKDLRGNKLNTSTTTITDFVDFIKPQIEQVTVTNPKNTENKTYTMSFNVIDKYLDTTNMVTADEILVYIDGELDGDANGNGVLDAGETPTITKDLTTTAPVPIEATMNKTVDGTVTNGTYVIGHKYTLLLSGFEQTTKQTGKDFMEWSGTVSIVIKQDAVKDTSDNTFDEDVTNRTITGEHVDFIKPIVEYVSSEVGTDTETIYFNVIDKYLDTTDLITESEITVFVDEEVANLTKSLERVTANDVTAIVNDTSRTVSQQYKLVLSGFEQSPRNSKNYKDWSGTVSIEIAENAVKDTSLNTLATEKTKRTIIGDFVDFIKPDIRYTHQSTDINAGTKTYTMTFDITDKYYTSGELDLDNLTINMQNGQLDSDGDAIVYNLKEEPVTIAFNATQYYAEPNVNITNEDGDVVPITTANPHQIGHTYTLTISGLDKLEVENGNTTTNYSGIITVAVDANIVKDRGPSGDETNPNGNDPITITSGIDIPGGTGTGTVVDVVSPVIDKISSSADPTAQTATITFKGTDTYFVIGSTIDKDDIQVVVDGSVVTSGITKNVITTTQLKEDRILNGTAQNDVQYGVQYTLEITGFAQNASQVKIRIPEGELTDQYGNKNKQTDLILYNCLELTSEEDAPTDGFLDGNGANLTGIARQDIEAIMFVSNMDEANASGVHKVWDVSAMNDNSIKAWTYENQAPYTVYIGSDDEIFANQNSKRLFAHIGYGSSCTAAAYLLTDIELLNVKHVVNMSYMFNNFGYNKMLTLDLGTEFDTSNVTDMNNMFNGCGQNTLLQIKIGGTSNTIEFNTEKVTNMSGMFQNFAYKIGTLTLGQDFDTKNVTDMSNMFNGTGKTSMAKLTLGSNFDTSKVTNMSYMFCETGKTSMKTLDLGDLFDTKLVTNMTSMFQNCGNTSMVVLDLGAAFTNIAEAHENFMTGCGTSELVIYAPEAIYADQMSLK